MIISEVAFNGYMCVISCMYNKSSMPMNKIGYCFYTYLSNGTFLAAIQFLDTQPRAWQGIDMDINNSIVVAASCIYPIDATTSLSLTGYIFYSKWTGSTFTQFTQTLDINSRNYFSICMFC